MSDQEKAWTVSERFGANLVWCRGEAGLSQEALGRRVGMDRVSIGELENGSRLPRLDTILRLAAGLDASPGELIAWIWWDPASDEHVPARFRVSSIGYEAEARFNARGSEGAGEGENDSALKRVDEVGRGMVVRTPSEPSPSSTLAERFGLNLWSSRRRADLSQEDLGNLVGLTRDAIQKLEKGRRLPRLDTIVKLASGTDVPTCVLLEGMAWRPGHYVEGDFHVEHPSAPLRASAQR